MKNLTQHEREKRIIARGEHSGHCHVITGDVEFDSQGRIIVSDDSNAVLRHILEKEWIGEGKEVWTGEHHDIKLASGTYEFVPQMVFDPLSKRIEKAKD
jgi:hypothetical protein